MRHRSCSDPQTIDVGLGNSVWVPNVTTCNTASTQICIQFTTGADYTYQLAAADVDRDITISPFVGGVAVWDLIFIVFPTQGSSCPDCGAEPQFQFRGPLTITALAGQAYTVVVENNPNQFPSIPGGSFSTGDHDDVAIKLPYTEMYGVSGAAMANRYLKYTRTSGDVVTQATWVTCDHETSKQ
ncbi:hypothetical protein HaLaN_10622 [Haematococcus lacustris]|uniref:Uncharacterized protein n=1 Tax=Haematococcus lacustris TaxID=44745 RepID=A0A699YZ91_HAELA|nr:hypothetical protein HaLaN_10622 [Haematococcus lacustris]